MTFKTRDSGIRETIYGISEIEKCLMQQVDS